MSMHEPNCDTVELRDLLMGDENSTGYQRAAAHIEVCHSCQQSLMQLAGDEHVWSETAGLLAEFSESCVQPDLPIVGLTASDIVGDDAELQSSTEFLSPPSHPEMLGRLGRYEIERVIGIGGMGTVLKGFDSELNRPVAIKVLRAPMRSNGSARQRFDREARAAAAVTHEHIVSIHNVETDGVTPFIVMQYVLGESLQDRVDREGPLPVKEILRIGMQVASGLAAAHEQGVVHRDIKPANILLESGVDRALLADFGLAQTMDDASLTRTGIIVGTPHYMSPEQANGNIVDHRSDMFSIGAVLYFMATGHPPFRAEKAMGVLHRICTDRHRSADAVNPEIPCELSSLIDRLLAKKAACRIGMASQLRKQLSRMLAILQEGRPNSESSEAVRIWKRVGLVFLIMLTTGLIAGAISQGIPWGNHSSNLRDNEHSGGPSDGSDSLAAGGLEGVSKHPSENQDEDRKTKPPRSKQHQLNNSSRSIQKATNQSGIRTSPVAQSPVSQSPVAQSARTPSIETPSATSASGRTPSVTNSFDKVRTESAEQVFHSELKKSNKLDRIPSQGIVPGATLFTASENPTAIAYEFSIDSEDEPFKLIVRKISKEDAKLEVWDVKISEPEKNLISPPDLFNLMVDYDAVIEFGGVEYRCPDLELLPELMKHAQNASDFKSFTEELAQLRTSRARADVSVEYVKSNPTFDMRQFKAMRRAICLMKVINTSKGEIGVTAGDRRPDLLRFFNAIKETEGVSPNILQAIDADLARD